MYARLLITGLAIAAVWGCAHKKGTIVEAPPPAPYQQFVAQNIDWSSIRRVVLMPLANQTAYPKVTEELQANLAAELQRAGRFDVVVSTRDDPGARAHDVFRGGRFDELELLRISREFDAQAVLFANVTQYHPYTPPRVGLSVLMVSPAEGVVIATADGVWDAREKSTASQAQNYYKDSLHWPQSLMGKDRILESPEVYQRFVCQQVAVSLSPPETGVMAPAVVDFATDSPLVNDIPMGVPPLMQEP